MLFGGMVVSGQGSLPLAMAKLITEFLIFSRLLFVVDNFVAPIDDRQKVTAAPKIIPTITRTMAISTSEKPFSFRNNPHIATPHFLLSSPYALHS
jgi:hypothetical protein